MTDANNNRSALRVLVVDDSMVSRRLTVANLSAAGHTVRTANNGAEAVRLLCDEGVPFDVILMDCHMPEMDGFAATAVLRGRPGPNQNVPVFALSGTIAQDIINQCGESGMNGCLEKPITLEAFDEACSKPRPPQDDR